jgi:hypothetical protein
VPEAGLHVYAFDDATYTNYNGVTDASGHVVLTLPQGEYRFRADKNGCPGYLIHPRHYPREWELTLSKIVILLSIIMI